MEDRTPDSWFMPPAELMFPIPNRTEKLDTTTSLADRPDISATAILQSPRPAGFRTGTRTRPIIAAKLLETSSTNPDGPLFNTNHRTMEARNMVVPALLK